MERVKRYDAYVSHPDVRLHNNIAFDRIDFLSCIMFKPKTLFVVRKKHRSAGHR